MMDMLSDTQLEMINKIRERGLIVLMSYRKPFPRWGEDYEYGEPLTTLEWENCQQLWKERITIETMFILGEQVRYRKQHWKSKYLERESIKMDDDYEYETGLQTRYNIIGE